MPSHLKRYHAEGHYHFLTFSSYRRFPYLGDDRSRTVFLDTLETLRERHRLGVHSKKQILRSANPIAHERATWPQACCAQDDTSVVLEVHGLNGRFPSRPFC
jgi:hypothetical protein